MKEKETKKLYNSMTNVKEDYIEEAQSAKAKKQHPVWSKWAMLAACLFLGVIATFAVTNIFTSAPENSQHTDTGIEDASLDGNPNRYSTVQEGKTTNNTNDTEIAEQDQVAQKKKTEDLSGIPDNGEFDSSEIMAVVSSYGVMASSASYKSPDNGSCGYSVPLKNAMEEYGDTVLYRVVVDVFSNNDMLETNSEVVKNEIERLTEIDYTVAFEHYNDGTMDHYYFVLFATQEQLINFVKNDDYGYMFWLYDERAKDVDADEYRDALVVQNPGSTDALIAYEAVWGGSYLDDAGYWVILLTENTAENREKVFQLNPTLNESNTIFKEVAYTRSYLMDLMQSLSKAELPSVVTSIGFREERNRVEVIMTADDADAVAEVLAYDTIGGAIEIICISDIQIDKTIIK